MKTRTVRVLLLSIVLAAVLLSPALSNIGWAKNRINVVVKTVLASGGEKYLDPRLSALIEELHTLFRYSSYRLLSEDHLQLDIQQTGRVSLPGRRTLKIKPIAVADNRIELRLVIQRKKEQVFQTVIQLLNHGSIIVGGPKHKDGSLLFSISASY
ncbi:MAG: hypothetical protein JRD47_09015 [Deltaproteobacteria bacterium]|nr:hypothetical protein [Deltaproteobacteria bacterium]